MAFGEVLPESGVAPLGPDDALILLDCQQDRDDCGAFPVTQKPFPQAFPLESFVWNGV